MIMNEEQKDLLERIYSETGIDADYMVNEEMPEDIDAFMEELQERIGEIEVIYHSRAMEYLAEEDPSLTESLGLAHESGYTTDKINSELLATILKQERAGEKIWGFRDEIEELFYPAELHGPIV